MKSLRKIIKKLTLFDYLVGGGGIIVVVFLGFMFLRKTDWKEVAVKAKPLNWHADSLYIGQEEKDGVGRAVAVIKELRVYERRADVKDVYMNVNLKVYYDKRKNQYFFKNQILSVGSVLDLSFSGVSFQGLVVDITGTQNNKINKEKIVEARLFDIINIYPETLGVQPWIVDAVEVGQEMKDAQGRVVAKILEKKVQPAEKIVTTDQGRVFVSRDPLKKDVYLKIWLLTWERRNILYFFDDVKVKIGENIPLFFPEINVYPVITKIVQ